MARGIDRAYTLALGHGLGATVPAAYGRQFLDECAEHFRRFIACSMASDTCLT